MNGGRFPWMSRLANDQLTPQAMIMVSALVVCKSLLNSDLMLLKGDQLFPLPLPCTVINTGKQGSHFQYGKRQDNFSACKVEADSDAQRQVY